MKSLAQELSFVSGFIDTEASNSKSSPNANVAEKNEMKI